MSNRHIYDTRKSLSPLEPYPIDGGLIIIMFRKQLVKPQHEQSIGEWDCLYFYCCIFIFNFRLI